LHTFNATEAFPGYTTETALRLSQAGIKVSRYSSFSPSTSIDRMLNTAAGFDGE